MKFLSLVESDSDNVAQNLSWAEQSARQAVLHDFLMRKIGVSWPELKKGLAMKKDFALF